jgi:hypothetical protein
MPSSVNLYSPAGITPYPPQSGWLILAPSDVTVSPGPVTNPGFSNHLPHLSQRAGMPIESHTTPVVVDGGTACHEVAQTLAVVIPYGHHLGV